MNYLRELSQRKLGPLLIVMAGVVGVSELASATGGLALIDVKPGDAANYVDTETHGVSIHVALLNTRVSDGDSVDFDASQVDPATVRFGAAGIPPDPNFLADVSRDVDGDGDDDLDFVFPVMDSGLLCGDASAVLVGQSFGGAAFSGSDSVATSPCPTCHTLGESTREAANEIYHLDEDGILSVDAAVAGAQAVLVAQPASGALMMTPAGAFEYQPEADFYGLDSFSYLAGGAQQTVRLSVYPGNDPPVASADTVSAAAALPARRVAPGLLANDTDIDGDPLSAVLVDDVTKGVLTLEDDGAFEYTPGPLFDGHDSFTYRVSDGNIDSEPVEVQIGFPNILLIMTDDIGQGDAQFYNPGSGIFLPALDRLASEGMRFTHAHSPSSACSTTRYSLLTGNTPFRANDINGVWNSFVAETMITPGEHTLGHVMGAAGYRNAFIGKLHNGGAFHTLDDSGYATDFDSIDFTRPFDRGPTQFGFDYSFLMPAGLQASPYAFFENDRLVAYDDSAADFLPFASNAVAHSQFVAVTTGQTFNGGLIGSGGRAIYNYDSRHVGPVLTNKAIGFIDDHLAANAEASLAQPFFLYLALPAGHKPHTPPPAFNVDTPLAVDNQDEGYLVRGVTPVSVRTDMIYETDVTLDALVAKLVEADQLENTLIIYTSDNGMSDTLQGGYNGIGTRVQTGRNGAQHINPQGVDNGVPLRGYKLLVYEGGHRVPFIARWGGGSPESSMIAAASVSDELVGLHDLMATFAELTGQTLGLDEGLDSVSFLSVLSGVQPAESPVRDHLIVQGSPISAYRTTGSLVLGDAAFYQRDASNNLWKLIVLSDIDDHQLDVRAQALFNLTADPGETADMISIESDRADSMLAAYLQLIAQNRTASP